MLRRYANRLRPFEVVPLARPFFQLPLFNVFTHTHAHTHARARAHTRTRTRTHIHTHIYTVRAQADVCGLDLPIFRTVNAVISGEMSAQEALPFLMSKPLGQERRGRSGGSLNA